MLIFPDIVGVIHYMIMQTQQKAPVHLFWYLLLWAV